MDERGLNVLVGFGVNLPEGTSITTRWGLLRARLPDDTEILQRAGVEYDPLQGCFLETRVENPWGYLPDGRRALFTSGIEDPRWKRVAIGLLLGQATLREQATTRPWCCIEYLDGVGGGGSVFMQYRSGGEVSPEELPQLERWLSLVTNEKLPEIVVDRTISMVTRITDHVDALIDGVIVWEALFGAGETQELSYRVSMSMACVLSDSPIERLAYQAEIKKFYTLRSKIVHGSTQLKSGEDKTFRDRVQQLTIEVLQALIEEKSFLLGAKAPAFVGYILGVRHEDVQNSKS